MSAAPYTLEALDDDSWMAYNDDLRVVAAGDDAQQALAHFAGSLVHALGWLAADAPERPAFSAALAWFQAQGPLPVCPECESL